MKLMSQWDFIMGKRLRLCPYYAVTQIQSTGKHQDLKQPVIMIIVREFLKRKLTGIGVYFSIQKKLINTWSSNYTHGNIWDVLHSKHWSQ